MVSLVQITLTDADVDKINQELEEVGSKNITYKEVARLALHAGESCKLPYYPHIGKVCRIYEICELLKHNRTITVSLQNANLIDEIVNA